MLLQLAVLVILGTVAASPSDAESGFTVPPQSLVENLSRQHHRGDWLRITTDSTRYEAQVRKIGAQGLSGLTSRRASAPVPESIPWSSVVRLDQRRSSFRFGQVVGFAAGAPLGLACAVGTGASNGRGVVFVALGAAGGAWLGSRIGDRRVRERTLYEPSLMPDSAAPAHAPAGAPSDSLHSPAPILSVSAPPVRPGGLDPIRIERAVRRLRPNQFLRIRGEFGEMGRIAEFEGFVARAGSNGLVGLRPGRNEDWNSSWPRELTWDRIGRIQRRGNSAGRGALVGAVVIGVPMGVVGMAAGAVAGSMGGATGSGGAGATVAAGALIGVAVGAAIGGALGGLFGLAIPRWHTVYGRQ